MTDKGIAILRISLGATMLIAHGFPKLMGFSNIAPYFPDPLHVGSAVSLGLAVFAEFFCALLLISGTAIRAACVPLIITMAVAFFLVHGADPFAKKELAFLYMTGFIALFVSGAGAYSLKLRLAEDKPCWLRCLLDTK